MTRFGRGLGALVSTAADLGRQRVFYLSDPLSQHDGPLVPAVAQRFA